MKGIIKGCIFAFIGGACITLQGVANARISKDIGTWQAAAVTQMTGFILAFLIFMLLWMQRGRRNNQAQMPSSEAAKGHGLEAEETKGKKGGIRAVKPLYLIGGAFGAVVIFSEVTAIQKIGVTFMISALLIAQLGLTFLIDSFGWFGVVKQKMKLPQFVGIGLMIAGVIILKAF